MDRITIRIDAGLEAAIAQYAESEGLRMASAARELIEKGLATGVTPKELEEVLASLAAKQGAERDRAAEALERAVSQMEIARKNIGKSTQASYGSLSLLAWMFKDLMRFFEAAGVRDERVATFAGKLTTENIFKFFEASGGALQGDGRTRYLRSFRHIVDREPYCRYDTQAIFGMSRPEWSRATGQSDDAAAVRSLAGKGR